MESILLMGIFAVVAGVILAVAVRNWSRHDGPLHGVHIPGWLPSDSLREKVSESSASGDVIHLIEETSNNLDLPPMGELPIEPPRGLRQRKIERLVRLVESHEMRIQNLMAQYSAQKRLTAKLAASSGCHPNSLRLVKGIGPAYEKLLKKQGVSGLKQLALLDQDRARHLMGRHAVLGRNLPQWIDRARQFMGLGPLVIPVERRQAARGPAVSLAESGQAAPGSPDTFAAEVMEPLSASLPVVEPLETPAEPLPEPRPSSV